MGGLRRTPLYSGRSEPPLPAPPAPAGVRVLTNCAIAPGAKMLAKDGRQVALLALEAATDAYDFDTMIVSPGDYTAVRPR